MTKSSKFPIFSAVAIVVGTIIGAGIFGIPYAIAQVGIVPGILYLVAIGAVNVVIFLLYAEVIERTNGQFQMTGHAERYLGTKGKTVMAFTMIVGSIGSLLVYMIGIGDFAFTLFKDSLGGSPELYSILFFMAASIAILLGLGMIVFLEKVMIFILIATIFIIVGIGLPHISIENLQYTQLENIAFPYGIVLFAFAGVSAVAEMSRIKEISGKKLKKSIYIGLGIPFVVYALFATVIVGITGAQTSQEAIAGLQGIVGSVGVSLGAVLGIITMGTSFLTLGLITRNVFMYDFKQSRVIAWVITCFIPLIIYLLGLTDFITVIGIVGSIMGGLFGIMVLKIHKKAKREGDKKPKININLPSFAYYGLYALFILGMIYEIVSLI